MDDFDLEKMRARLEAEIKRQRRSMSETSLLAGLSKGYVRNVIVREQVPTIDKLHAICEALEISVPWVLYGQAVPKDAQEIFDLLEHDPKKFYALLELARR